MIGGHPHRLNAMQPLAAAQHMLVDKNGAEVQDEGELVFMGMRSATDGYMGSSSSKVTRDDECPTSERLHTGDVFNQVEPGWYQPVCRRDDLIVHTTGEMTNPLLIETRLKSLCDAVVANLCVFGQGQAKPFLVVQLREGMDEKATRSKVLEALAYLNATSKDLLIPASHVIWADAPLPTSAKGNVIRGQVEERYREHVNRGRSTPTSTLAWTQTAVATQHAPDAGVADMLALVLSAVQACVGSAVSADAPLMDAGIDSLSAVELMEALQQIAGRSVRLSSTTLFDHPTARRLAHFLAECARPEAVPVGGAPAIPHGIPTTARSAALLELSSECLNASTGSRPIAWWLRMASTLVTAMPAEARVEWVASTSHAFPAMAAGFKLGLFDALAEGPLCLGALADRLGSVDKRGLACLVRALACLGYIEQEEKGGVLHGVLGTKDLEDARIVTLGWHVSTQRQFYHLDEAVRHGRAIGMEEVLGMESLYKARSIPEVKQLWDPWMQRLSWNIANQLAPRLGAQLAGCEHAPSVLDWCGSLGYTSIRLAESIPSARFTVLDLAHVCERAAVRISDAGLSHRVGTLPCDLCDPAFRLTQQYDAVVMIHTIREWSAEEVTRFFTLIHEALVPGGVVFVNMAEEQEEADFRRREDTQRDPRISETMCNGYGLYFLCCASHNQHRVTHAPLLGMLQAAGFVDIEMTGPYEPDVCIARKAGGSARAGRVVGCGATTAVTSIDWQQKAETALDQLSAQMRTGRQTAAHATSVGAAPDAGVADMLALVLSAVQACVGSAVSADAPLMDAGIDSLSAVELMEALQQIAGRSVRLSSTTLFDHPTARRLAHFLAERAIHQPFAPPSAMRSSEDERPTLIVPAATLAQGWRAPGGTFSVLSCGCDLVGLADSARWDTVGEGVCSLPDEAKHARYAAFMCGVELFDHSRFGMSSAEASVIDPQQRVLLEHSLQVFRGSVSHGMHTGVFLGAWAGDYADAVSSSPVMDSIHYLTGTGPSNMAGRIAFAFDLHGPCIAADAACSSALVAAHLASRTLEKNECQVGLTAGANIIFSPVFSVRIARAGMTSILGRYE